MITSVHIINFKSLKHVDLQTRNLNLLTGLNGSGKSSLIQAFLLLEQSPIFREGQLWLKGPLFDAGVAEDVYYQYGIEKEIVFSFTFIYQGEGWFRYYNFACDPLTEPDNNILRPNFNPNPVDEIGWPLHNLGYLTAERTGPQNTYGKNVNLVEEENQLGIRGEYAVHFLHRYGDEYKVTNESLQHPNAKSELLIHQVDAWMTEIAPGVQLYTEEISNEEVRLSFQFSTERGKTNQIKPKNVGFGLTYVLPVIVSLLTATPDKLILIENPESHIHPRGQVELGRLLAGCAQSGAQLFIETHSDHILNGLRLAVREGLIDADKAVAFYFKRSDEDNCTDITPIVIDTQGKLHRQTSDGTTAQLPKGFLTSGPVQWQSFSEYGGVFNELSVRPASSDAEARQWLETLAELGQSLRDCVESLSDNAFTFRRSEDFGELPLTTSQTLLEFLTSQFDYGDAVYNFLLGVFDAPYITEDDPQHNEYAYTSLTFAGEEHSVTGLAAAYLKNALAVSFDSDAVWNTCHFTAQINRLDADDEEVSGMATIEHASRKQHIIDCHLGLLSDLFKWPLYQPKPTVTGLLPLLSVYSLHVESWEVFYHDLSQLATGERVNVIVVMAERIARLQRWVPATGNLKIRNANRTIYTIPNSNLIVSVDTQHGEFEVFDQRGNNHLGALSFDGKRIKDPDAQRHLKT